MTTLHSSSISSLDNITSSLQEYETVSTHDLVHYPENNDVDFRDSLRQRSYNRAQSKQARDARIHFVRREEQRNRQKQEQRRLQILQLQQKQKDDTDSDSNNNNGKNNKKNADRSNRRADRHRRPEDEILSESSSNSSEDEDEDDKENDDDGYSSGHRLHRRHGSRSLSSSSGSEVEDVEEHEERIRFKHNLTFKTDDDGTMPSARIDCRSWKQVYVQKLDEKDQARDRKKKDNNKKDSSKKDNRRR